MFVFCGNLARCFADNRLPGCSANSPFTRHKYLKKETESEREKEKESKNKKKIKKNTIQTHS